MQGVAAKNDAFYDLDRRSGVVLGHGTMSTARI